MKISLLYLPALLLAATTAVVQHNFGPVTASLTTVEETATGEYFVPATDTRENNAILKFIRPVTVAYKDVPWFLMVLDIPDEKQVVHFT